MADLYPIQNSFAFGAISQRLFMRGNTDRYQQAVALCHNFEPLSQGPLQYRRGLEHVAELAEQTANLQVAPFQISEYQEGVVVIGEQFFQVYDRSGPTTHQASIERVSNPSFDNGLGAWMDGSSGTSILRWDPVLRTANLIKGSHGLASMSQSVVVGAPTEIHTLRLVAFNLDGNATARVAIGTTAGGNDLLEVTPVPNGSDLTYTFTPPASPVYLTLENNGLRGSSQVFALGSIKNTQQPTNLAQAVSPYAGLDRQLIQWAELPNEVETWFAQPNQEVYSLKFDGNDFTLSAVAFTNPPSDWSTTPPIKGPGAITFFEQRAYFGGAPDRPESFRSSKVGAGNYNDLSPGTAQPDEAMDYTIARRGRIAWMRGAKELIVGTENAEYVAVSEGPALKPGDIELLDQSVYGSLPGQVESLGDRVAYASGDETSLRTMSYEWTRDAWVSVDLAWPSEHLTQSRIKQVVFRFDDEQAFMMTTRDVRTMLICMFNREQSIIGWGDLSTQGDFLALTVTRLRGISDAWVATRRFCNGGGVTHYNLERRSQRAQLDGAERFIFATPTSQVTGLNRYEEETVGVLVDGAVHPDVFVEGGTINLKFAGTVIDVGYRYPGVALSLPLDAPSRGTAQSRAKGWGKTYLRLTNSHRPRVSQVPFMEAYKLYKREGIQALIDAWGGPEPPDREAETPMDTPEPPSYEDFQISPEGLDLDAALLMVHERPVPCEIVGVFGDLGLEEV